MHKFTRLQFTYFNGKTVFWRRMIQQRIWLAEKKICGLLADKNSASDSDIGGDSAAAWVSTATQVVLATGACLFASRIT